jgi:hypothetical protein
LTKKALLINPWITGFTAYDFWLKPLALLYLSAGFQTLFLSQESASAAFLNRSSPKVSPADLSEALTYLESAGFERKIINVYLITGSRDGRMAEDVQNLPAAGRFGSFASQ